MALGSFRSGYITGFHLRAKVIAASMPARTAAPAGMRWVPLADVHGEALPNVMRKVVFHVLKNSAP
jgi:A/G-specific adenine glycosylase